MSSDGLGLTPAQREKLETAASRWGFDGIPDTAEGMAQLYQLVMVDAHIAAEGRRIAEERLAAVERVGRAVAELQAALNELEAFGPRTEVDQ